MARNSLFVLLLIVSCTYETRRIESYEVQGIDVSHHQKEIDWPKIAEQGVHFAFAKATEGSDHVDTTFDRHWEDMKRAGIVRGAYHYFSPYSAPKDQVARFRETVQLEAGDMPPVLDVEIAGKLSRKELSSAALKWLISVDSLYGVEPIIYTNQKFYLKYFVGKEFDKYPVWIARYRSGDKPPFLPFGKKWDFWQYGNCGHLEGVEGCLDFNVFNGSRAELDSLLLRKMP